MTLLSSGERARSPLPLAYRCIFSLITWVPKNNCEYAMVPAVEIVMRGFFVL